MKYSYILITIIGIGLLYSTYHYYQENTTLSENFQQLNTMYDERVALSDQYEAESQALQEETENLEVLLAESQDHNSDLNDENVVLLDEKDRLSETINEIIEINSNTEGYVRVTLYNVSFEYPEELIVTIDDLYLDDQIDRSGIFIATSSTLEHVISLSWEKVESQPNLTDAILNAYDSFDVVLSMNQSSMENRLGQEVVYASYAVSNSGAKSYYVVSNWFDESNGSHFVLVIQNFQFDVLGQFESFISSYRNINSTEIN